MVDPERVLICVASENRAPYSSNTINLFRSLRAVDGPLSDAQAIAYFMESVDSVVRTRLEQLGVTVRIASTFDERCKWANKLALFSDLSDYDYLVALDTDTVIVRDFSAFLSTDCVLARIVADDQMRVATWNRLFEHFGLRVPTDRYITAVTGRPTAPYFNSGVIIVPQHLVGELGRAWAAYVLALLDAYPHFPEITSQRLFTDQRALTLALIARDLPYRTLPIEMNFQTPWKVHPLVATSTDFRPYILHYHWKRTREGRLAESWYPSVNASIDRVNALLDAAPSVSETMHAVPGVGNKEPAFETSAQEVTRDVPT